ncbi:MAG: hypothetical protein GF344_01325, partial [Chitinivibrionales bacterium]|nr:hypothetical protein [Chitinivibrionales bacterium]
MAERLILLVRSVDQLAEKLNAFIEDESLDEGMYRGCKKNGEEPLYLLSNDADFKETVEKWIAARKVTKLSELWVNGLDLEWKKFYGEHTPKLISLPAYPFAREKHWIDAISSEAVKKERSTRKRIHPLLHTNTSDLSTLRFTSEFSGHEFFLSDYGLKGSGESEYKAIPSSVYIEMAHAGIAAAIPAWVNDEKRILELHDIAWGRPYLTENIVPLSVVLVDENEPSHQDGVIAFEIISNENRNGNGKETVHCRGYASHVKRAKANHHSLNDLKGRNDVITIDSDRIYEEMKSLGLYYGGSFRNVTTFHSHAEYMLAEIASIKDMRKIKNDYVLHPAILECAIQTAIAFGVRIVSPKRALPALGLETVRIHAHPLESGFVYVRSTNNKQPSDTSVLLDIDLCDKHGNVCIEMHGLSLHHGAIASKNMNTGSFDEKSDLYALPEPVELKPNAIKLVNPDYAPNPSRDDAEIVASPKVPLISINEHSQLEADLVYERKTVTENFSSPDEKNPDQEMRLYEKKIVSSAHIADSSLNEIEEKLKKSLSDALFMQPNDIDIYKSFTDLGLDSIIGVEWIKKVNESYGIDIPATRVYDYKNINEFASYLAEKLGGTKSIMSGAALNNDRNEMQSSNGQVQVNAPYGHKENENQLNISDDYSNTNYAPEINTVVTHAITPGRVENVFPEKLENDLRSTLAEALFMLPEEIDINKSFVELGLDSIVGVEWVKKINVKYGTDVSATTVYDYSTLKTFAAYLAKELHIETTPMTDVRKNESVSMYNTKEKDIRPPDYKTHHSEERIRDELKNSLAEALFMKASDIDIHASFVDLGLDSIVGVEWVKTLNDKYGTELSAVKVYDYSNIASFASYLKNEITAFTNPSSAWNNPQQSAAKNSSPYYTNTHARDSAKSLLQAYPLISRIPRAKRSPGALINGSNEKIAIVGMSGRYPEANNLSQYWNNLAGGKNAVSKIPPSRWDIGKYYNPDPATPGTMYCTSMGMLDDVDCFDPLFFQISPSEAEYMDPQHRLFLEESYRAFEYAGYSAGDLSETKCGVFLGIMSNDYNFLVSMSNPESVNITGNSYAIGASRLSYFLNLKGPAIPFDTACSSSLVAIHTACQGLRNREIDMALAGGVTLYLIPESYVGMCQAGMLSNEGQCKAFDDSADGFVPGEGVGAIVLKRLRDAERDNDSIYGVIIGSGINQDGKTNGITAPSVKSQISLERDVYDNYKIDPETISYVEAHGTGTKLGDPIELEALGTVFREKTEKKNYCAIGSVKSNIGHTSGAAGVAGVHKVLLSMMHKTIVPTLHVTKENKLYDFKNSPFYVCKEKKNWEAGKGGIRRACVSSFGFSGTNAHLVLEEYIRKSTINRKNSLTRDVHKSFIIPLSARKKEQLRKKAIDLFEYITSFRTQKQEEESGSVIDLLNVAYTLQVGREAMKARMGFIVDSVSGLEEKLKDYIDGKENIPLFWEGTAKRETNYIDSGGSGSKSKRLTDSWIQEKLFDKILESWVNGIDFDWKRLYRGSVPQRIGLPTYPFARERYWITQKDSTPVLKKTISCARTGREAGKYPETVSTIKFSPQWCECPPSERKALAAPDGPIMLMVNTVTESDDIYRQLYRIKRDCALIKVCMKPNGSYIDLGDNIYDIDMFNEIHYHSLVEKLRSQGILPYHIIFHDDSNVNIREQKSVNTFASDLYALIYLCKALLKEKIHHSIKIISLFTSDRKYSIPQKAALGAFFKTI